MKPPYRVPSMAEIRAADPCGLVVATTFGGCGGSSTGYRMAGYRVAYANEFSPIARASYAANADPATVIDGRDIREVRAADIGEVDLLDGSPPCTPFSSQGKLSGGWGVERADSAGIAQRIDDLFFEFARLAGEVRPKVLVAENVAGLVRGVSKGYFKRILARLRAAGFVVRARLIDASWLGVPQTRRRLVFVGVRDDLGIEPVFPRPLPWRYSIADALGAGGLVTERGEYAPVREHVGERVGGVLGRWSVFDATRPCPTLQTSFSSHSSFAVLAPHGTGTDPETGHDLHAGVALTYATQHRGVVNSRGRRAPAGSLDIRLPTLGELRALAGFPPDFELTGSYADRWGRIGNAVPPVMMAHVAAAIRDSLRGA